MAHSSRTRTVLLAATVLLLGACQELPRHPGDRVQILEQGDLTALNPADIAVAPVEYAVDGVRAPDRMLREVVAESLVKRRYSPLALDFVDSRVIDASYRYGTVGEEAVCQIVVHEWDERLWEDGRVLRVDVELRMVDPNDPTGRALWSARYPGQIDATPEESHVTESALYRWAVAQVAAELAGALPARVAEPGRR